MKIRFRSAKLRSGRRFFTCAARQMRRSRSALSSSEHARFCRRTRRWVVSIRDRRNRRFDATPCNTMQHLKIHDRRNQRWTQRLSHAWSTKRCTSRPRHSGLGRGAAKARGRRCRMGAGGSPSAALHVIDTIHVGARTPRGLAPWISSTRARMRPAVQALCKHRGRSITPLLDSLCSLARRCSANRIPLRYELDSR